FIITLFLWSFILWLNENCTENNLQFKWNTGLPGTLSLSNNQDLSMPSYNPTGNEKLDHIIEHLIYLIMQDFILNWHDDMFKDAAFPETILTNMHEVTSRLSKKMVNIKWTNLFAIKINAILTLHVKIFIKAIKKLNEKELINENHDKIETEFFNIETLTPTILSHKSLCTDSTKEIEYLTFIIESFLYLLLPEAQFDEKTIRYLVRDLLVSTVILPFINKVCDPDYVNQIIIRSLVFFFMGVLMSHTTVNRLSALSGNFWITRRRITNSISDLHQLIEAVQLEITTLSGNDMDEKESEDNTKKIIASLLFVKRLCASQIESIRQNKNSVSKKQCSSNIATSVLNINLNSHDSDSLLASSKLEEIPLKDLLESNLSFPYLIDYYQEVGEDHVLFLYFWIKDLLTNFDELLTSETYIKKTIPMDDEKLLRLRADILSVVETHERQFVLNYLQDPSCSQKFYSSSKYAKLCSDLRSVKQTPSYQIVEVSDPCGVFATLFQKEFNIDLIISDTIICGQPGHQYYAYVIHVMILINNSQFSWKVNRRFRHFVEFHENIINKFPILNVIKFPEKVLLGNNSSDIVDKRKIALDSFLKALVYHDFFKTNKQFFDIVVCFLDKRNRPHHHDRKLSQLKDNEFLSNFPSIDPNYKSDLEIALTKNAALNIDYDEFETMAMSLFVNLIEELFDLRTKTPWLARQIKSFVKELFIAAVGDRVISANCVIEYLNKIRESFWPGNVWAGDYSNRTEKIKARERIIATSILIGSLPSI
ncbi:hypothetical protein MXB_191, partial [Myxobolus squamalis]